MTKYVIRLAEAEDIERLEYDVLEIGNLYIERGKLESARAAKELAKYIIK